MRKKPNAVHKRNGSFRSDKHGTGDVEAPPDGMTPPDWLLDGAAKYWGKIEPMLRGMKIDSEHYTPMLGLLANAFARYIELEAAVTEHGIWSEAATGTIQTHPAWTARCKALDQCHKLCAEFGMTPVSVGRVTHKPNESKDDGKAKYFEPRIAG